MAEAQRLAIVEAREQMATHLADIEVKLVQKDGELSHHHNG